MAPAKKKAVVCGIAGYGRTLREAKENAMARIEEILENLRRDSVPRVVHHRGLIGLVYRNLDGIGYAIVAEPDTGVRTGRLWTTTMLPDGDGMDEGERALKRHLAQTGWRYEDGTEPPDILADERDRSEFRSWAAWQLRYRAAREAGASDAEAFRIASEWRPATQPAVSAGG